MAASPSNSTLQDTNNHPIALCGGHPGTVYAFSGNRMHHFGSLAFHSLWITILEFADDQLWEQPCPLLVVASHNYESGCTACHPSHASRANESAVDALPSIGGSNDNRFGEIHVKPVVNVDFCPRGFLSSTTTHSNSLQVGVLRVVPRLSLCSLVESVHWSAKSEGTLLVAEDCAPEGKARGSSVVLLLYKYHGSHLC